MAMDGYGWLWPNGCEPVKNPKIAGIYECEEVTPRIWINMVFQCISQRIS
jgi:hypothetical protein